MIAWVIVIVRTVLMVARCTKKFVVFYNVITTHFRTRVNTVNALGLIKLNYKIRNPTLPNEC
jgi:hypothetical protein